MGRKRSYAGLEAVSHRFGTPDHTCPLKLFQKPFYVFGAGVCFSCSSPSLITVLRNYRSQYSNPSKNEKAELNFKKKFQITVLRNSHFQYSNPAKNEKAEPFL